MDEQDIEVFVLDEADDGRHAAVASTVRNCEAIFRHDSSFSLSEMKDSFEELVTSRACGALVRQEVDALSRSGARVLPATNGFVFALAESENFILTLSILSANASTDDRLYSLPNDALIVNLSPADFPVRLHQFPQGYDNQLFDPALTLVPGEALSLAQYQVHFWDSARLVPEYLVRQDHVIVKLNSKRTHPMLWCFDKAALRPTMTAAASPASSRLNVFSSCLSEMAGVQDPARHEASVTHLKRLCGHRLHFVRWAALQNLFVLDSRSAIEILRAAVDQDPHPEVRDAARQSLDMIAG